MKKVHMDSGGRAVSHINWLITVCQRPVHPVKELHYITTDPVEVDCKQCLVRMKK